MIMIWYDNDNDDMIILWKFISNIGNVHSHLPSQMEKELTENIGKAIITQDILDQVGGRKILLYLPSWRLCDVGASF